jgi:nucleoside-diphosphate-sugar epimerase
MKILITGNMGYVGPVVVRHLRSTFPSAIIEGVDTGFYAHCLTSSAGFPETRLDKQHYCDVREMPGELLDVVDAVIQLAAISNDPMGKSFERVTREINFNSTLRLAELSQKRGVRSFTFASSCSVYGAASNAPRREDDDLNPLTEYAHSKVDSENALRAADLGSMAVTCLRFATACGMSERLRLDLVLNDFVASALTTGKVQILSDGTPWRPLIDVHDMARAFEWAITRSAGEMRFLAVNTGADDWNYQVIDLARAVAAAIPDTEISISQNVQPDKRSYRVDFSLFKSLAPRHVPKETLAGSIDKLRCGLLDLGFHNSDFRNSYHVRLRVLEEHIAAGRLNRNLRWTWAERLQEVS